MVSTEQVTLNQFLADVEARAFRMARVATHDSDVALDIVQEAMMKLAEKYSHKPNEEWRPLFFSILSNRINDWHRQQQRRWRIFDRWFGHVGNDADKEAALLDEFPDDRNAQPDQQLQSELSLQAIEFAVTTLSPRQQQAFMLRCWEGLSTDEASIAMNCSAGTVKTLYSRALQQLREMLSEHERSDFR